MARRKQRRRVVDYGDRRLYREVFVGNASMLERIGCILDLGADPGPPSNSAPLEHALTALAENKPEPQESTAMLIAPIELAVGQLFHLRDSQT